MEWLNYHHLRYFWAVAREGGVARAAARLNVSQPAVSAQLRELEAALGAPLVQRAGRGVALTEAGRTAFRYADEIFGLGRELLDAVKGRGPERPSRLVVGVVQTLPKLIAFRLLEAARRGPEPVQLVVREEEPGRLFGALAVHELDVVLADGPLPPTFKVRAFSHLLGECGVALFGARRLAVRLRRGFPASLTGAPMLLPGEGTALRRALDQWLEERGLRPVVTGIFDDSALLKTFGEAGTGVFAAPTAVAADLRRRYGVAVIGTLDGISERFYAISAERRLRHPAIVALSEAARTGLLC